MKKYFGLCIILAGLVVISPSYAQEGTENEPVPLPPIYNNEKRPLPPIVKERKEAREEFKDTRNTLIQESKEKRETFREERKDLLSTTKENRAELEQTIKEKREALKGELETIKKERLSNRKTFVENRFGQVIATLEQSQTRIGTKIDELKTKGYSMDEASKELEESKGSLSEAKTLLESLKTMTVSDTDETSATKPREVAKQIETLLRETRGHLVNAIQAMKESVRPKDSSDDDQNETATTTN